MRKKSSQISKLYTVFLKCTVSASIPVNPFQMLFVQWSVFLRTLCSISLLVTGADTSMWKLLLVRKVLVASVGVSQVGRGNGLAPVFVELFCMAQRKVGRLFLYTFTLFSSPAQCLFYGKVFYKWKKLKKQDNKETKQNKKTQCL